jgi:MFS family permease
MTTTTTTTHSPKHSRLVTVSPVYYGWIVWLAASIGWVASAPGQSFTVALFFDFFIEDFGLSRTLVSSLYGGGTFVASLSLTFIGRLIDRYGNRRMSVVIALCFAIVLVLMSFVTGPITLFLGFLAIRGFGQGSMTLVNTTVIAEWFKSLRGRVMSFSIVGFSLFQAIYVPFVARQLEARDWREVWVLLGVSVAVFVIPILLIFIRNKPEEYGLIPDGPPRSTAKTPTDETSDADDLPEISWTLDEAMRTHIFWVFLIGRIISPAWGTGLIIHQISIFEGLGYAARVAADTYAIIVLVSAGSAIVFGWLVDRIRPGWVLAIQLVALIVAMWAATVMTGDGLRFLYALSFGLVMGGGGVIDSAVWTNVFGRAHQGSIRGFVMTVLVAGTAIGPVIFGLGYDMWGAYTGVLYLGIAISLVAVAASLLVDQPQDKTSA